MPLTPGTTLGPYEIVAPIGAGGMGEVYQARDTKLDRDVALKVLPEAFTSDPDRLARFEREAKVLASLNHPNIGSIYGLEEADGVKALVLELIEGPTLADRIKQGPIPVDEALPIAKQIAEALEAAHEAGVIHRDLKPANIKVREDGTVKVLDFGLAKALDTTPEGDPSQSPTLTAVATQMGVIMGTAAYMSPEQAKGKVADRRSDVWAFGAVLFEMLSGRRAFIGADVSDTLVSVFRDDPDWAALPSDVPVRVRQAIEVCLQKDRKQRVGDISAIRLAMEGAFETALVSATSGVELSPPPPSIWRRTAPLVGAALVGGVSVGGVVWMVWSAPLAVNTLTRFVVDTPPDAAFTFSVGNPDVAISPDGTRVAYMSGALTAERQLYVRQVDQIEVSPLRGTEGGALPFFSPDGEWVGFWDGSGLKRVSVLGGPAVPIVSLNGVPRGASWGIDGTIVFAGGAGLMEVPAVGGDPVLLTTQDSAQGAHRWPEVLPDGRGVLFTTWLGSSGSSSVALLDRETGSITQLIPGGSSPRYVSSGHIVYGVDGTLRAVGFDLGNYTLTGNSVPVLENVNIKTTGAANFGVSDTGALVYVAGMDEGVRTNTLVWVDQQGREEPLSTPPRSYDWVRLSPGGDRAAVEIASGGESDIWLSDLARGTLQRLTSDPSPDESPLWSPDARRVVFSSTRDGRSGLFWKPADGPGAAELVVSVDRPGAAYYPDGWSPDGSVLLVMIVEGGSLPNLGTVETLEDGSWQPLLAADEAAESGGTISPDGQWIAYHSDETGRREVYAQRFPDLGEKRQISVGGGQDALWAPNGRTLYYLRSSSVLTDAMMAVAVDTEPRLVPGQPEVLFEGRYWRPPVGGRRYDLSPDGSRFLMIKPTESEGVGTVAPELVWVERWATELDRLVPVDR